MKKQFMAFGPPNTGEYIGDNVTSALRKFFRAHPDAHFVCHVLVRNGKPVGKAVKITDPDTIANIKEFA